MLVVDFMHKIELGVWKSLFTHLLHILDVAAPNGMLLGVLNKRYNDNMTTQHCCETDS